MFSFELIFLFLGHGVERDHGFDLFEVRFDQFGQLLAGAEEALHLGLVQDEAYALLAEGVIDGQADEPEHAAGEFERHVLFSIFALDGDELKPLNSRITCTCWLLLRCVGTYCSCWMSLGGARLSWVTALPSFFTFCITSL